MHSPARIALGCLPLIAISTAAIADMRVLESTVPAYKRGAVLPDDARLSVPRGASVRLLLSSGRSQTISGPHSGPVSSASTPGVVSTIRTQGQRTSGGTTGSVPPPVGGTIQAKAPPSTKTGSGKK